MKTINNNPPIIITTDKNTLELETKVREQDVYYYHVRTFGLNELKLAVHSVFEKLPEVKRSRKRDIAATKPIVLKQLQSCRKEKK